MAQDERILSGIKVVELATYIAAPSCARILGEWGAEVIKVESPRGDVYRYTGVTGTDDENPVFAIENTGKKCISIDLKSEAGSVVLDSLLETADVFVTNFRVEALAKLNLTYEVLSEKYPTLIYAHGGGYGDEGPLSKKPGFDSTAFFARTGLLVDMAQAGETPCNYPSAVGDHTLGMYMVSGVLGALFNRTKTGKGDYVSSGLFQASIYTVGTMVMMPQNGFGFPQSRYKPANPLNNIYKCRDGKWIMLAGTDYLTYLKKFSAIANLPVLVETEIYTTQLSGLFYSEEITQILDQKVLEKDRDEWYKLLEENDFPCEILQHIEDLLQDEQAWANNFLKKFTYPSGNTGIMANSPLRFASQKEAEFRHPPRIGGDTAEVLKAAGYSEEKIAELAGAGTIVV